MEEIFIIKIGSTIITKSKRTRKRRIGLILCCIVVLITCISSIYGYVKPLPKGLSYEGEVQYINEIEFLTDRTYEADGDQYQEQEIFEYIYKVIEEAEQFIVVDMFLFNDDYDRSMTLPPLSQTLVNALIGKKQQNPDIEMIMITDRINTFYGSYASNLIHQLEENGITVILTDMRKTRDSNPVYSGGWRAFLQWFGTEGNGWLPNPFSPDSPDVTLRSYLELLNFKANHRKLVITERQAVVSSANPHDGSAEHSNIAFAFSGEILHELLKSERAVAVMSGANPELFESLQINEMKQNGDRYGVQLLTEGKIKDHILEEIRMTDSGDSVTMGAFYLSDRDIISALKGATGRGVHVRLILDPNKDAFGREKNGIPNRPVAHELVNTTNGNLQVRWYRTSGEQYHAKLLLVEQAERVVLIGGSANFTKRNLADFNLETNLKITMKRDDELSKEVRTYFDVMWDDERFTLEYEEFADPSILNQAIYRFQEWSGMSTF
ncbi:phospholipase D family protein [Halalkalibacter urbisdiaboli]|uniref:phospholipase D family protein n=1 Tax=Halalkalibacter urbisdiaboli TaxID=1960589 RepID=UPI000B440B2C|nr:phospholipase D family protein [Halalkalibacter urbisdiaboli]